MPTLTCNLYSLISDGVSSASSASTAQSQHKQKYRLISIVNVVSYCSVYCSYFDLIVDMLSLNNNIQAKLDKCENGD